jgi:hypothetical protein
MGCPERDQAPGVFQIFRGGRERKTFRRSSA